MVAARLPARLGGEAFVSYPGGDHARREFSCAPESSGHSTGRHVRPIRRCRAADAGTLDLGLVFVETVAALRAGPEISGLADGFAVHNRTYGGRCAGNGGHLFVVPSSSHVARFDRPVDLSSCVAFTPPWFD